MERLTLDQAAARLGISAHTARRRVRSGVLRGEREPVRGGYRWVVIFDGEPQQPPAHADTHMLTQVAGERDHLRDLVAKQQETIDRLTILLAQSQGELARVREAIQIPERVGEHVARQPASHAAEPVAPQPHRRPWYRRLLGLR